MIRSIEFTVPFVKAKARPRLTRSGRAYTPSETTRAERDVARAFDAAGGTMAKPGTPVLVRVITMRRLPDSAPKRVTSEPDVHKPDADNVAKLVLDGLNGHLYQDDSQVVDLQVIKAPRRRKETDETLVQCIYES